MDFPRKINSETLMLAGYCGMFVSLPLGSSPVEICGAFVIGVWVLSGRFLKDVQAWFHCGTAVPVVILVLLPWIGLAYSPVPEDGLHVASKGFYWLYAVAMVTALRTDGYRDLVLKMFLTGLGLTGIVSVLQIAGLVPLRYGTPSGLLGIGSPWITYSLLLTAGIFIASFYFHRAQKRTVRLIYGLLMLMYFVTIGFVGGRSGYIAFIVLSPLLIYHVTGRRHVFKVLILSVITVSVLLAFPVVQSRFAEIKKDLILFRQGDIRTSIGMRFFMWEIAGSEIRKSPFLGIGTSGFKKAWELNKHDQSLPFYDHPHNSFLYMMVSFGIAGLIAFCWLLLVLLRKGWRFRETAAGFALFSFAAVFTIGSLTDTTLLPFPTAVALTLFTGIAGTLDG